MIILAAHPLVHLNATLNAVATVLLVVALVLVKRGAIEAHKRTMLSAIGVSAAFLVCYLYYHATAGHVKFTHEGPVRAIYYAVLLTHVLLAVTVPYFALRGAYLGLKAMGPAAQADPELAAKFRAKHRGLVRWGYPIWLYVSVTGVLVYFMLYHWWPPEGV